MSKQTFQVLNVKCGGCASTLRKTLEDKFGEVRVELRKEPREITLDIEDDQIPDRAEARQRCGAVPEGSRRGDSLLSGMSPERGWPVFT